MVINGDFDGVSVDDSLLVMLLVIQWHHHVINQPTILPFTLDAYPICYVNGYRKSWPKSMRPPIYRSIQLVLPSWFFH